MRELDDDTKLVIADRLRVAALPPDELWPILTANCRELDQALDSPDSQHVLSDSVADALSNYPDQCGGKVLEIFRQGDEAGDCLAAKAARMAGRMRLAAAVPHLFDLLSDERVWGYEDAHEALIRIGTAAVVAELSDRYATVDSGVRIASAYLLKGIHSDLSVETALQLLENENRKDVSALLIRAALMNFASAGFDVAREFILAEPKRPEVLELRSDLLLAAKMLGVDFPELAAWTEDAKNDAEYRRDWYSHPIRRRDDGWEDAERWAWIGDEIYDNDFDDGFEAEFKDDEAANDEAEDEVVAWPPAIIVRQSPKIGRNDPCPCGSGKKYKKCCLGKRSATSP